MTVMTEQPITPEQTVTMSAADLQRLIYDATQGGGDVPPGAYRENGQVYRDVLEPTGRVRPVKDTDGKATGRFETVSRRVQRGVYLTYDRSPGGLVKGKRAAQNAGLDFYHPKFGWLRNGCKREVEVAENLGTGAQTFDMVYTPIETEDDIGTSVGTMQGVASAQSGQGVAPASESTSGLAGFGEALNDGPPPQEPASSRRNR